MRNEELFRRASKIGNRDTFLLFFILYNNGVVRESDLQKVFRFGTTTIRKSLSYLANLGYAHFAIDKDKTTYYVIDKMFYEEGSDFYNKLVKTDKNVKIVVLGEIKTAKPVSRDTKMVGRVSDHLKELYRKTFRGSSFPCSRNVTEKFCKEMLIVFKKMVKSSIYEKVLLSYLDMAFKKMSESAGFNLGNLSDMDRIAKYIDNKSEVRNTRIAVCDEYGMNCTYLDPDGCRLKKDGLKCSETIREHMKNKYGFKIQG